MAKEIEHKYLVISGLYRDMAIQSFTIVQGYLNRNKNRTVRVRLLNSKAFLTIKGLNEGDVRLEFEYEIPIDDAKQLLELCERPLIEKIRYIVPYKGYVWEVDEFQGNLSPLSLAEIELKESSHNYPVPSFIGKEVTGDPAYYNSALNNSPNL